MQTIQRSYHPIPLQIARKGLAAAVPYAPAFQALMAATEEELAHLSAAQTDMVEDITEAAWQAAKLSEDTLLGLLPVLNVLSAALLTQGQVILDSRLSTNTPPTAPSQSPTNVDSLKVQAAKAKLRLLALK